MTTDDAIGDVYEYLCRGCSYVLDVELHDGGVIVVRNCPVCGRRTSRQEIETYLRGRKGTMEDPILIEAQAIDRGDSLLLPTADHVRAVFRYADRCVAKLAADNLALRARLKTLRELTAQRPALPARGGEVDHDG